MKTWSIPSLWGNFRELWESNRWSSPISDLCTWKIIFILAKFNIESDKNEKHILNLSFIYVATQFSTHLFFSLLRLYIGGTFPWSPAGFLWTASRYLSLSPDFMVRKWSSQVVVPTWTKKSQYLVDQVEILIICVEWRFVGKIPKYADPSFRNDCVSRHVRMNTVS